MSAQKATVVLVHGAWADGSCWQNVILPRRFRKRFRREERVNGVALAATDKPHRIFIGL
jgi:hypothetical protein